MLIYLASPVLSMAGIPRQRDPITPGHSSHYREKRRPATTLGTPCPTLFEEFVGSFTSRRVVNTDIIVILP